MLSLCNSNRTTLPANNEWKDNNVTNYIIQMMSELCVIMLSIWQFMKLQAVIHSTHRIRKDMTASSMLLVSLGEGKAMLSQWLVKNTFFLHSRFEPNPFTNYSQYAQLFFRWLKCRQMQWHKKEDVKNRFFHQSSRNDGEIQTIMISTKQIMCYPSRVYAVYQWSWCSSG